MAKRLILLICFILIALAACTGMAANPLPAASEPPAHQTEVSILLTAGTDRFSFTATSIIATATANALAVRTLTDAERANLRSTEESLNATVTAFAPYAYQTRTVVAEERATYFTMATQGTDVFEMTATSIVATATANALIATYQAQGTPIGCVHTMINRIDFYYSETIAADWLQNPNIHEYENWEYLCYATGEFYERHQIIIRALDSLEAADLYLILEDAISRLPSYPPVDEATALVLIINIEDTAVEYGRFSYSQALSVYEEGLRGAELAEALGIAQPE